MYNKEMPFLSADQFEATRSEREAIMKWRDVPTGVIFKIENGEEVKTKIGGATVIDLLDCDGDRF